METLQDRIGFLLRHAYLNLNRDFRKRLTQENITTHQYVVLRGLDELGEAIQRTLAEYCAIEPSNLNVMVKRMKEKDLIQRAGNRDGNRDGARDALALTPRGRDVLKHFKRLDEAVTREFLAPLSLAEARTLHATLKKLAPHGR